MNKDIKIEANSKEGFPFIFFIEKAIAEGTEEKMSIKGVASTVNIDHDNERMAPESLISMAKIINEATVPLRVEHQKSDNSIIGSVNKAWVDGRNQLWIEADLDKSHPAASMLYKSLKAGAKLGLSVGGRVKKAVKEFSEKTGKIVKTFYDVVLDEVSVCQRPANYDAYLVQKSIISKGESGDGLIESPFYKEFISETAGFDYVQTFAKSIPDSSWKKVEINKNNENNNMSDKKFVDSLHKEESKEETETKEKAESKEETPEETKEKAEDKKETTEETEKAFKSMVVKSLESLTSMIAKLQKSTTDEETTIMEDKKKSEEDKETDTKEKAEEDKETETKEKAEETKETEEEKEKAEGDKENETTEDSSKYQMKSMKKLLTKMQNLEKEMNSSEEDKTKEKAEEDKETETEKSQNLDQFVDAIEKMIDRIESNFQKSGTRVLGLRSKVIDLIKNDKEIQEEITKMQREPGFKKSLSFGTPVVRSKEGISYKLVPDKSTEEVKKSVSEDKSFKSAWGSKFSPTLDSSEQ